MENWGLITYRETALLYQPNISSSSSQSHVASVIAHELAHQWFGNLVTMRWWIVRSFHYVLAKEVVFAIINKFCYFDPLYLPRIYG